VTASLVPADRAGVAKAVEVLRAGGVVALPTDTVYGIATTLDAPRGVERLFVIKERPTEKAVMVLVDALDQVADLVELTPWAGALASLWPGGLTLVLPMRDPSRVPAALTAGQATLGVRVPDHPVPRALARAVGPIPATSANRSGMPDSRSAADVLATLGDRLDVVIDGGPSPGGTPSTVVDCSAVPLRVYREGAIPLARVEAALRVAGVEVGIEA
jgi:L-threonylcarbamoyladenylate synthase